MFTFLNVGSDLLLKDFFLPIKNDNIKPKGGLWATYQNERNVFFNEWVDYLSIKPYILFYKRQPKDPFKIPATFITLKENAKIFIVNNENTLNFLIKYYNDGKGWIDFEILSKDCDGIFIKIRNLLNSKYFDKLKLFAVNSLILFNLDCISYYQKANIEIAPYDFFDNSHFTDYEIKIQKQKNKIDDAKYYVFIKDIIHYLSNKNISNPDQISTIINTELSEQIKSLITKLNLEYNYNKENEDIENLLIRKLLHTI